VLAHSFLCTGHYRKLQATRQKSSAEKKRKKKIKNHRPNIRSEFRRVKSWLLALSEIAILAQIPNGHCGASCNQHNGKGNQKPTDLGATSFLALPYEP
jgi:hypothetical protein